MDHQNGKAPGAPHAPEAKGSDAITDPEGIQQHTTKLNAGTQAENVKKDVPAFQFSVLTCAKNLLATKTIKADGTKIPFGKAKYFQFKYCEIGDFEGFAKALDWLADQPNKFIIRGQLKPGLTGWQRRLLYPKDSDPATIECPPRRWIVLDLDGIEVPEGLGCADRLADAGYYIRDHLLPLHFQQVKCVASATSSTGRNGPSIAYLRLWFMLSHPADNDALYQWIDSVARCHPSLKLDPSVLEPQQPIYTARPLFIGCRDPVPWDHRVAVLEGPAKQIPIRWAGIAEPGGSVSSKPNGKHRSRDAVPVTKVHVCSDMPDWMVDRADEDAEKGVHELDTSSKAWIAIKRMFEMLDRCPRPGGEGRHKTLTKVAWELVCLVSEGEVSETIARQAYWKAAEGINNSDGKYDAAAIQRRLDDAFMDLGRR
jgi:hypothetical protein